MTAKQDAHFARMRESRIVNALTRRERMTRDDIEALKAQAFDNFTERDLRIAAKRLSRIDYRDIFAT